jgi:peptidyl-prolyl cis-trans isomerase A (cyclophilin A)
VAEEAGGLAHMKDGFLSIFPYVKSARFGLVPGIIIVLMCISSVFLATGCKQNESKSGQSEVKKSNSEGGNPVVIMSTSKGDIKIELFKDKAPITVENFLSYVNDGFYDGTIFHRVIPNFMIQGGGFTPDFKQKPTKQPIKNEAANGLKNLRGTMAMARTQDVDSATSQFFINLVDNGFLDKGVRDYGYAVFGKVIDGMDVVDAIGAVETGHKGMYGDVPQEDVVIKSVKIVEK